MVITSKDALTANQYFHQRESFARFAELFQLHSKKLELTHDCIHMYASIYGYLPRKNADFINKMCYDNMVIQELCLLVTNG